MGLDPVGLGPPLGTGAVQIIHKASSRWDLGPSFVSAAVQAQLQILLATDDVLLPL